MQARNHGSQDDRPAHPREGEVILRTRAQRLAFAGGVVGVALLALLSLLCAAAL
jgi:hypothetical protein